jgi:hypothetical protein
VGQRVRHHIGCTWQIHQLVGVSEMKARWRCWQPEVGGETLCRANIRGLWSVHSWKGRPSSRERKCFIPDTAARSSRAKVE